MMKELEQLVAEIQPTLEKIEIDRLDYHKRKQRWMLAVALPVVVVAGLIGLFLFPIGLIAVGVGLLAVIISYCLMVSSYGKAYISTYKSTVIERLVNFYDDSLHFDQYRGIDRASFENTELFTTRIDRYKTEDLISGSYGGTKLALAEVHAEKEETDTDSDGHTTTRHVDIFKGLLLIADFHKHFHGRTFVFPDVAERTFGKFGRSLQKLGGRHGTSLIQMEDVEFEQAFAVHSTDQIEARYILSPAMMRRLLDMKNRFGSDVRVSFKESSVCIAVPHKSSYLEPCTSTPANNASQVKDMAKEISIFLTIVEELDLNTRIWTKE